MRAHWEEIYRQKVSTELSWFQPEPTRSLAWISSVASDPETAILDVGAGASVLVDRLLDLGYRHPAVLDVASSALAAVQRRLGPRGGEVEWFTVDVLDFVPPRPFDVWHDRAALHFVRDPEQQRRYAEVVRKTLKPGGYALISTFARGGPEQCSGLEVVQYDCDALGRLLGSEFRCLREETELHRTPAGVEQLFQYCLFQRIPAEPA